MIFKRFSRAGLLALAGALVLAILLSLPTFHASFAETAAEALAAAAAAAQPACDAKTLTNCSPNSGDTAWMLTSVAIVLMMTIPGLALFYGGENRPNWRRQDFCLRHRSRGPHPDRRNRRRRPLVTPHRDSDGQE